MIAQQPYDQPIDVIDWAMVEEYAQYPEGARVKALLLCPESQSFKFLRANHRYLFKQSSHNYPEQYWMEIFAYYLGMAMRVPVPPAFVAYNSSNGKTAALIEWFLFSNTEESISGGDFCTRYIPNYDRKKGTQHNFQSVIKIFSDLESENNVNLNWIEYWAKTFVFDALIGNTDRHQDNWCVIEDKHNNNKLIRIGPVFDNGTSMGHEILKEDFQKYDDKKVLDRYIAKGWHHMRWAVEEKQPKHRELLIRFLQAYPEKKSTLLDCLAPINEDLLKSIFINLIKFDVPVQLTADRADFMLKLVARRQLLLIEELDRL